MSQANKPTNIQIFLFFIGFVTLFILIFVLGVVVGKGLSNRGAPSLDNETAVLDEGEKTENFIADKEEITPSAEDQIAAPEENDQEISDQKTAEEEILQPLETEVIEPEAAKPEAADIEPALKKVAKSDEESTENQLGYKQKSQDSPAVFDLPATDPSGEYTIQVGSFKDKSGAEKILNLLKSKGYPAFMKTALTEQNETWFRIRIGTFNRRDVAIKYFEVLKSKEKDLKGFITLNN